MRTRQRDNPNYGRITATLPPEAYDRLRAESQRYVALEGSRATFGRIIAKWCMEQLPATQDPPQPSAITKPSTTDSAKRKPHHAARPPHVTARAV